MRALATPQARALRARSSRDTSAVASSAAAARAMARPSPPSAAAAAAGQPSWKSLRHPAATSGCRCHQSLPCAVPAGLRWGDGRLVASAPAAPDESPRRQSAPATPWRSRSRRRRQTSERTHRRRCVGVGHEAAGGSPGGQPCWSLRRAAKADIPQIEALQRSSREEDRWTGRKLEEEFGNGLAVIMLAESTADGTGQQRLLGMGIAWHVCGETQVLELLVAKEARRKGLGAALLESLRPSGDNDTDGPVMLEVRASNEGAIALYRRLGLFEVGRRKGYYPDGEDAMLMNSK